MCCHHSGRFCRWLRHSNSGHCGLHHWDRNVFQLFLSVFVHTIVLPATFIIASISGSSLPVPFPALAKPVLPFAAKSSTAKPVDVLVGNSAWFIATELTVTRSPSICGQWTSSPILVHSFLVFSFLAFFAFTSFVRFLNRFISHLAGTRLIFIIHWSHCNSILLHCILQRSCRLIVRHQLIGIVATCCHTDHFRYSSRVGYVISRCRLLSPLSDEMMGGVNCSGNAPSLYADISIGAARNTFTCTIIKKLINNACIIMRFTTD